MTLSTSHHRYLRRLAAMMAAYLVLLAAAVRTLRGEAVSPLLAWPLALAPSLPIVGVFWALYRLLLEEQDEFLRLLYVRQMLVATGLTLSLATGWGFLEQFALVDHIPSYWVAVVWFAGLGAGAAFNRLTLGSSKGI